MRPDSVFLLFPAEVEKLIRDFWPASRHIGDFKNASNNDYSCFYCGFRLRQKMIDTRIPILEKFVCGSSFYYTCSQICHVKAEPIQYYFFAPEDLNPFEKLWYAIDIFIDAIYQEEFDDWRDIMYWNEIINWDGYIPTNNDNDDDDDDDDDDSINMNHDIINDFDTSSTSSD